MPLAHFVACCSLWLLFLSACRQEPKPQVATVQVACALEFYAATKSLTATARFAQQDSTGVHPYFLEQMPSFNGVAMQKEYSQARGVSYTLKMQGSFPEQHRWQFVDYFEKMQQFDTEMTALDSFQTQTTWQKSGDCRIKLAKNAWKNGEQIDLFAIDSNNRLSQIPITQLDDALVVSKQSLAKLHNGDFRIWLVKKKTTKNQDKNAHFLVEMTFHSAWKSITVKD